MMGEFARSPAAPPDIDTSTEDTARLSFETGAARFMINYPFVYPSAKENAPDVFKQMGARQVPGGRTRTAEPAAARRHQPRRQRLLREPRPDLRRGRVPGQPENQVTAATLGGLPPTDETALRDEGDREGLSRLLGPDQDSIDDAAPRPVTPAYTDLSLAIQRALHPVATSTRPTSDATYDELVRRSTRP